MNCKNPKQTKNEKFCPLYNISEYHLKTITCEGCENRIDNIKQN